MLSSARARVLVDVFLGLQVAMVIVSAIMVIGLGEALLGGLALAGAVVIVGAWVAYRRGNTAWTPIALVAGSVLTVPMEGGLVSLVLLLMGLALVVLELGITPALVLGSIMVAAVGWMVWSRFHVLTSVISETIGNIAVLAVGIVVGLLLRQIRTDQNQNARLLAELRLAAMHEKELMLADERSRSARELHDGLGHRITLIAMTLEYAQRMRDRDADAAWTEVGTAQAEARSALAYMRRWVRALNPPREPNLEGTAALEAIADSFRGTGLSVEVEQIGAERELDKGASLFAYRLLQEGLTNVLRHSTADQVMITVHWLDDQIDIELADNGGAAEPASESGFGLRSLSERAMELGGTFSVRYEPEGVILHGRIPAGVAS